MVKLFDPRLNRLRSGLGSITAYRVRCHCETGLRVIRPRAVRPATAHAGQQNQRHCRDEQPVSQALAGPRTRSRDQSGDLLVTGQQLTRVRAPKGHFDGLGPASFRDGDVLPRTSLRPGSPTVLVENRTGLPSLAVVMTDVKVRRIGVARWHRVHEQQPLVDHHRPAGRDRS